MVLRYSGGPAIHNQALSRLVACVSFAARQRMTYPRPVGTAVRHARRSKLRAVATRTARAVVSGAAALAMLCVAFDAAEAARCRPKRPRPVIVLKSMGACEFNPETASFKGEPAEQLRCLLRALDRSRNLGPLLDSVPAALAERAGQTDGLPSREALLTL